MSKVNSITPPPAALAILQRLTAAGFSAHVVGGCVRDALLGHTPADWDICTAATPDEVRACFSDARVVNTGIVHGTVTVLPCCSQTSRRSAAPASTVCAEARGAKALVSAPLQLCSSKPTAQGSFEITTYRTETGYADHRRPDSVAFTKSLSNDLARRDFTINAMAYSPADGLVDLYGGQADLAARVLRCVGDPAQRFAEDALRILRALRFAATLGFALAPETAQAALDARATLRYVSRERVYAELTKLLCGAFAGDVLRHYAPIVFAALPQLAPMDGFAQNSPYHDKDVWQHTAAAIEAAPPDAITRWALLLHDSGKPQCYTQDDTGRGHFYGHGGISAALVHSIFTGLHADAATRDSVQRLVRWHDVPLEATAACVSRWLHRLGEADLRRLLDVKRGDAAAHAPGAGAARIAQADAFALFLDEALAAQLCLRVSELALNGSDLLALGVPQGPRIGSILHTLLCEVLAAALPNERKALLARCEALIGF